MRSFKAFPYIVAISRPDGAGGYGAFEYLPVALPATVQRRMAPELHIAKFRFDETIAGDDVWNWKDYFNTDDYIAIFSAHETAIQHKVFGGFITEINWGWNNASETCTVTAVSPAGRLANDICVFGRYMFSNYPQNPADSLYTAPDCDFNASGRANCSATEIVYNEGLASEMTVPVFTYDNDPAARLWTVELAVKYLLGNYNFSQPWVANVTDADLGGMDEPVQCNVNSMSLWEALAAVCRSAGYDVYEVFDSGTWPKSQMVVQKRYTGAKVTVKKQVPDSSGNLAALDLDKTNAFSGSMAESAASCVTSPIVAGGAILYEVTCELTRGWDDSALALGESESITMPGGKSATETTWQKRYCTDGSEFSLYANAGRLWDFNSDGRFENAPYSRAVGDMSTQAGLGANLWPKMPYKPYPCISKLVSTSGSGLITGVVSIDSYVEYRCHVSGGWTSWQAMDGYRVLNDRVGIYLTLQNLASYPANATQKLSITNNIAAVMLANPDYVQMRLTCCAAGPNRTYYQPPRRSTAGTIFSTSRFFDRGTAGQMRVIGNSVLAGYGLAADTATAEASVLRLAAVGAAIQDAAESRTLEANFGIEWPDEPLELGYVVTRVEGMGYELGVCGGAEIKYPRIVGIDLSLDHETWNMAVMLDSTRKAALL